MYIAHVSHSVAENHIDTGPLIKSLYIVTERKKENPEVSKATKMTYDTRLKQALKCLFAANLQNENPSVFNDRTMKEFVRIARDRLGYSSHTIRKIQDLMILVLEECRYERHITAIPQKAKLKHKKPIPVFLTREELEILHNITLSDRLEKVKDVFLIQCYSGASYCDIKRLKKKYVTYIDGIPVIQDLRQKTNLRPFTIPLLPQLKTLLDKYDWNPSLLTNQPYNRYLKEIMFISGIEKTMSTKIGRSTCAMLYLTLTGNYDATAAVLGNDPQITKKHYAPYLPMHLIEALKKSNIFGKHP